MSETPSTFSGYYKSTYQGETALTARPPWDIGEPQTPFVELHKAGLIKGEVLDAGCGNGEISLFLAAEGHRVTGVDIAEGAIAEAARRAQERKLSATFAVGSALDLSAYEGRFETVVDCGLFHALPREAQAAYAAELRRATVPGARAYLLEMSAEARVVVREKLGAAGVPEQVRNQLPLLEPEHMREAFSDGWTVVSLEKAVLRVRFPGSDQLAGLPAYFGTFQHV